MRPLLAWMIRIAGTVMGRWRDREFDRELAAHIALHIEENVRAGMSRDDARRTALLTLGGMSSTLEGQRERQGLPWVDSLMQDLRYGSRMLWKSPGFTLAAVGVLAIGVAANILIFGIANASLLRGLPIGDPGRVVRLYFEPSAEQKTLGATLDRGRWYADFREYAQRTRTLRSVAGFSMIGLFDSGTLGVRAGNETFTVSGGVVTGSYFQTLDLHAPLGRLLLPSDDVPGAPGVAVLSDALWRRRFGANPSVVGQAISLNGHAYTIVGVAPPRFVGTLWVPLAQELWVPWNGPGIGESAETIARHEGRPLNLIGRLAPGATLQQAAAELSALETQLADEHSTRFHGHSAYVYAATTFGPEVANTVTSVMALMLALVGLVLLVACVNIATLLLARSAARQQEFSIRRALGAGRLRLIRQLLAEVWLLTILACSFAYVMCHAVIRAVPHAALIPSTSGLSFLSIDFAFDWRVVTSSIGLAIFTTLACGLVPALQVSKRVSGDGLKGRVATPGHGRMRLRGTLMTAQVAMATLLLVVAGQATQSLLRAYGRDLGFRPDGLFTTSFDLSTRGYSAERGARFVEDLLQGVERIGGVHASNVVHILPTTLTSKPVSVIREGDPLPDHARPVSPVFANSVSRGHFVTLGIRQLAGRDFNERDTAASPAVAIVNETFARRFFEHEMPVGKRLKVLDASRSGSIVEIVGLVRDSTYSDVGEPPKPFVYLPVAQEYTGRLNLVVSVPERRTDTFQAIRAEVQSLDPDVAFSALQAFDTSSSLVLNRLAAGLAGVSGLVAVVLTGIGLYGVIAYVVRQRTREIGIRIALGARRGAVVWTVVQQGARWTVTGVVLGMIGSIAVGPVLSSQIYGVRASDPIVLGGTPPLLLAIALAACAIPARRASRIDPIAALREE